MKRFVFVLALFATVIYTSCEKEEKFESKLIQGLTLDNYPRMDGSTSTLPLNVVIACELLGIGHEPYQDENDDTWGIKPDLNKKTTRKFDGKIKSSQTHQSIINLIDGKTDITLSARKMSPDEKAYADAAGVSLIETPIALDAFIFIVHRNNTVESLTIEQIQGIYTGEITDWEEVGGSNMWGDPDFGKISPYVRNANSGSQELMEELVMKDLNMLEFPTASELFIPSMTGTFNAIDRDVNGISYTVYYYKEHIKKGARIPSLAVNGITPNIITISNKTYPFVTEVYAVIRSDLDESSMAHKVYEFLQTNQGKQMIRKSGYLTE